jgi:hypothetical protein
MRALRILRSLWRQEFGQGLVLAALAMVVILGFAAMAVDVGYWFSQKGEVQKAVDAAALAGAQELPDDYVAAEAKTREYLLKNGVDEAKGDTVSITFRCTSTYLIACKPATNHWDTIVVRVERPAEAYFARVFGIQEALIRDVHAAGCNGPCGGAAYQPVDVVQILDRTGSMTLNGSPKLANAKAGARALLEYFQPSLQRVGLAVLPASVSWADPCHVSSSSTVWLPVNLSNDYQNPDGTLNTSSRLVSTIDCLESSGYTNLGSPLKAATDELVTNGRPGEKWGIILLSDGAANTEPAYNTELRNCTLTLAASGGDGDGFQTSPLSACTNGSGQASDASSGTDSSTGCASTYKDRHDFYNYGISVPGGNEVKGIEVRLDAWVNSTWLTNTRRMCVELSGDGGTTWTTVEHRTANLSSSQETYTLGGNGDLWGRTWSLSELSDANFRVRVTNVASNATRTFYLDWAAVRVYYGPPSSGPCDYAARQGDAAKALNPPIEVFTIGYGLDLAGYSVCGGQGNTCECDSGFWKDRPAAELLEYIATDADHFFNEPSTADLRPIFEVIGSHMASGSRLVE